MLFIKKTTILTDGRKVHDIDLLANGRIGGIPHGDPICIFSCPTKAASKRFLKGLRKLVDKHTDEIMWKKEDV